MGSQGQIEQHPVFNANPLWLSALKTPPPNFSVIPSSDTRRLGLYLGGEEFDVHPDTFTTTTTTTIICNVNLSHVSRIIHYHAQPQLSATATATIHLVPPQQPFIITTAIHNHNINSHSQPHVDHNHTLSHYSQPSSFTSTTINISHLLVTHLSPVHLSVITLTSEL